MPRLQSTPCLAMPRLLLLLFVSSAVAASVKPSVSLSSLPQSILDSRFARGGRRRTTGRLRRAAGRTQARRVLAGWTQARRALVGSATAARAPAGSPPPPPPATAAAGTHRDPVAAAMEGGVVGIAPDRAVEAAEVARDPVEGSG